MEEMMLPWPEDELSEKPESTPADQQSERRGRPPGRGGSRRAGAAAPPGAGAAEIQKAEDTSGDERAAGPGDAPETVLTVSEVNRMARNALERMTVTVQGEVSGLNTRYPYFVYFDLRDAEAALPAIMQRRLFEALEFKVEDGASVVVRGTLSLFERQGKYQVKVADLRPFGEGDIQRRIEALKRKLQAEGLFDDSRKKRLPAYPERIGVVTSPRGAAVRDITVTLARRYPPASVFVRGARVQGEGAVRQICEALEFFDRRWPVDLVILARGGGSIQDLEPFSTEPVARALAEMSVPVVTGIGHEPDVSIADLVADLRASTPTGAAEAAVPERAEVRQHLAKTAGGMRRHAAAELAHANRQLAGVRRLPLYRGSEFMLGRFQQRFERVAVSLPGSPSRGLTRGRHRLAVVASRPVFRGPGELLARGGRRLEGLGSRLALAGVRAAEVHARRLETAREKARVLSPLAVLERGYSITFNRRTGSVVRSPRDTEVGAPLRIRLAAGEIDAEVTGKE